jgi:hypothetical protein
VCLVGTRRHRLQCARQCAQTRSEDHQSAANANQAGPQSFTGEEYFERLQKQTQTLRERIWNPDVRVHESIAAVWAPYDFWADGKFSHCGIDVFDLIKTSEGEWKIAGGVFTMEAKREPSPLGPLKP